MPGMVALPAPAEMVAPAELTLAELEMLARERNPSIVAAAAHVEAARGQWLQAGLHDNPTIGYHGTEIGNVNTAGQQGAFVSQKFVTFGKRRLDRAAAAQEIRAAEANLAAQRLRVQSDVRIGSHDVLIAQRQVELAQELVKLADETVAASKKLVDGGQASPNDLTQAEIEYESAGVLLDDAQHEHLARWRRLAAIVGIPDMQPTPLVGDLLADLPQIDWHQARARVLGESPELAAAEAKVARANFVLGRQLRERLPDVDLSVSVRHNNVTTSDMANVQVGFPLPVFDRNQGNIVHAEYELAAASYELEQTRLDLQDRLAAVYRDYASARQQVDRYVARILPLSQKSLDQLRESYGQGQADYLELLTARRTYVRANLDYLKALRDLRTSATTIQGNLLRDSLRPRPGP